MLITATMDAGQGLAGSADAFRLGAAADAAGASPALASWSSGGLVAVWQGGDSVPGGAGAGLWAQVRGADGAAGGAAFALTPDGDARIDGEPAVAALAGGRFVVAYSSIDIVGGAARVAYRVVEADGSVGAERLLATGAAQDTGMPAIASLADGTFVVGWRGGGAVHVQQAGANGMPAGAEQVYGMLSSAFSPSIAALRQGGYLVTWGELNDGNVYAATSGARQAFVVNGDGYAASLATAAPLPHATTLANGNVVIAWDSYVNAPFGFSQSDIFFQIHDSSGRALGAPVQANLYAGSGRYDAAVTGLSDGSFVVAWQAMRAEDGSAGVFGRHFGADGTAIDAGEFAIDQAGAGAQAAPDLVALAHGGFAAAWVDGRTGEASVEARVFGGAGTQDAAAAASLVGTAGIDTAVFAGQRGQYQLAGDKLQYALLDAASGARTALAGVERLQFSDQNLALDIHGNAGQAYRLYQAAFDRTPDKAGLGYWIAALDHGMSLQEVAHGFVDSAEFASLYGEHASDARYLDALYQNVLHRAPDAAGYDFWLHAMQVAPRDDVLVNFSESAENQAQVIGAIANGIDYLPWTG